MRNVCRWAVLGWYLTVRAANVLHIRIHLRPSCGRRLVRGKGVVWAYKVRLDLPDYHPCRRTSFAVHSWVAIWRCLETPSVVEAPYGACQSPKQNSKHSRSHGPSNVRLGNHGSSYLSYRTLVSSGHRSTTQYEPVATVVYPTPQRINPRASQGIVRNYRQSSFEIIKDCVMVSGVWTYRRDSRYWTRKHWRNAWATRGQPC